MPAAPQPPAPHACEEALERLGTVFGLEVRSDRSLSFLAGAPSHATGRPLEVRVAGEGCEPAPRPAAGELVCDQRERDGSISFRIHAGDDGYLIAGPAYGGHLLSRDGRRVLCMPGGCAPEAWQRLLIAQVLPFAALLNGLEVLHASAVVIGEGAVVLAGPSRAGKTSVALELCRRGGRFLADDVLALERSGEELWGQPGSAIAGVDHGELARLERGGPLPGESTVAVNARERLVRTASHGRPSRVRALFFLERRGDVAGAPRFEPTVDAPLLLGASFNSVIVTPGRLGGLLEICALLARGVVERVAFGPGTDASELAGAIEDRLGAQL